MSKVEALGQRVSELARLLDLEGDQAGAAKGTYRIPFDWLKVWLSGAAPNGLWAEQGACIGV